MSGRTPICRSRSSAVSREALVPTAIAVPDAVNFSRTSRVSGNVTVSFGRYVRARSCLNRIHCSTCLGCGR